MSRFTRLVVATLLICTFGTFSTPAFAASSTDTHERVLTRWEALIQNILNQLGVDIAAAKPVNAKDSDGDPLPDDPNKPNVPPEEGTYVVDPAG